MLKCKLVCTVIDLNKSEIDLNRCGSFLKANYLDLSEIEWPLVEANLNTVRQLCISSLTLICVNLAFQRENKIKSSIVIYKTTKSCIGHIIWLAVFHIMMLIVYIYRISVVINKISMLDWVDNSSLTIGHA